MIPYNLTPTQWIEPIRPEHFAEHRKGVGLVCGWCGATFDEMRADVRCPDAPRTVHGVDRLLFAEDPIYHKLVVQGRILRRHYRADHTPLMPLSPDEFRRLYEFSADDWAAARERARLSKGWPW